MRTVSNENFGLVIAYIVPGVTALCGVAIVSETVRSWLGAVPTTATTISGFLYITLASIGVGVLLNTARMLTIDQLWHATGLRKPTWNYQPLQQNIAAIEFIILNQFRFHQFHGNTALALLLAYGAFESAADGVDIVGTVLFLTSEITLLCGSRQCLSNYYDRLNAILGKQDLPEPSTDVQSHWTLGDEIDKLRVAENRAALIVVRSHSKQLH